MMGGDGARQVELDWFVVVAMAVTSLQAEYRDPEDDEFFTANWAAFPKHVSQAKIYSTGAEHDVLMEIAEKFCEEPEGIEIHPTLKRILKGRKKALDADDINWATGEALAFGSLLLEGTHVRLSGQDVERGTFSHRHHVLHDQEVDGKTFCPLANLREDQAHYTVVNSHLSEYAVLGFEYGYSGANPNQLVMWEAQFGDFANTAQCIIDQFISSGQAKWGRQSGLVLLLPHGYEGMGPEHSSARLERFLQMSDDEEDVYPEMDDAIRIQIETGNWQVANPTTPANIFHLLRRQVYREFRKPLVVMSPKSLLNHPEAKSSIKEMGPGTKFVRLYPEQDPAIFTGGDAVNNGVRRLIFCSGKVYYDMVAERKARGITDVAIARIEQISPFPFDLVHQHSENFPEAEIVWAQEEPRNMGGWSYVDPRIETALSKSRTHAGHRAKFVGRKPSASTAAGDKTVHKQELKKLLEDALGPK
jgi:2-oxoglutarate dehydrogenase E1 component